MDAALSTLVPVRNMTIDDFLSSLYKSTPPQDLSIPLLALWYDAQNQWDKAHDTVQNEGDAQSALVHAYLHRKEGDLWNAKYWYNKAGRSAFSGGFDDEWNYLTAELLQEKRVAA